jgi:hypothetical protein
MFQVANRALAEAGEPGRDGLHGHRGDHLHRHADSRLYLHPSEFAVLVVMHIIAAAVITRGLTSVRR